MFWIVLWEKSFGGSLDDKPIDIIETGTSEFCIAATTESFGSGTQDIYLIWIDQSGNLVRQITFGGSDIDGSSGLIEIENNKIMLYGYTRNFGARRQTCATACTDTTFRPLLGVCRILGSVDCHSCRRSF